MEMADMTTAALWELTWEIMEATQSLQDGVMLSGCGTSELSRETRSSHVHEDGMSTITILYQESPATLPILFIIGQQRQLWLSNGLE